MHLPRTSRWFVVAAMILLALTAGWGQAPLKIVGVLGNTSGMSDRPFPYAYYTGIAADARGRLYFAGASQGVPVADQDGNCLAVLKLPQGEGLTATSRMVRAGEYVFCVAARGGPWQGALYRIDTRAESAAKLVIEQVATGPGLWVLSPALDAAGRVVVGQSEVDKKKYTVTAYVPTSGQAAPLFSFDLPQNAMWPWMHNIQVEPDGTISVVHRGVADVALRFDAKGQQVGKAEEGQVIGNYRYFFGYAGNLRRTDLQGKDAPGDCGSEMPELRMAGQMVPVGERYFFVGRGGAAEAKWNGTNFVYQRRMGAVYLEDISSADGDLVAAGFSSYGNNDVMHPLAIPKNQPLGTLLISGGPFYGKTVATVVAAPDGMVAVYRAGNAWGVGFFGIAHREYDLALPMVKSVGQAAVLGNDLLLADPEAGTIWRRPLLDKTAPPTAWVTDLAGVTGIAVGGEAVYVAYGGPVAANATPGATLPVSLVSRLAADGQQKAWTCPQGYVGIRRLAATPQAVYVCDTAAAIVDQLDAATGAVVARLGVPGQPGTALDRLVKPWAVAADANGVYISDLGAGRVDVATTTLWKPQIVRLPREDTSPIVAAKLPVSPPKPGRMSVNIYDQNDLTVRQLVCAGDSTKPVTWDGKDLYGDWAKPGKYRFHGIIAPKLSLRYVGSLSQSGNPQYRTPDGKGSWGGVWGNVMDVCPVSNAPDSDILVLWAVEEGEGGLVRMSQDGEVLWKSHLDWWFKAGQVGLACDGESVYIVGSSAMDAPQGQTNYGGEWRRPMLWRVEAATGNKRLYGPSGQSQPMFGEYLDKGRIVTDIAIRDGKLYITAPAQNKLFVADATNGKQVAAWEIPEASGVAWDAQGRMLVGSGSKIAAVDANGQVTATVVADTGGPVWAITATADGFAASVGGTRNQVVYYNAQGKETRTIGKAGGRPLCGKMQPENLLNPVGLCAMGNGRLFVAEDSVPRRFTRWSATGAFEKQFHGPYYLSGMFGIDEENPNYVYGDTHGSLIRYTFDYKTAKWDVDAYWTDVYNPTDNSNEQGAVPAKWWPRIRHHNGKTWWCSGSAGIVELSDGGFRPLAAIWGGWVEKQADGSYRPANKPGTLKGTWSDLSGDGKAQPEEWNVTDKPVYPIKEGGPQQAWGAYFDEQFNCYMHDWSDTEVGGVWKIPVEWKGDVPTYNWEHALHVGLSRDHGLQHGAAGARTTFAYGDAVFAFNGGYNAAGLPGVGHGHDWEFAQVTKYDQKTGKPLWFMGERAPGYSAPGQMACPTGPTGVIGDYLFWNDENSQVHAWDIQHGLYVDTLLEDVSRNPTPGPYTVWVELFNTRIFRHPADGKVYLLAASDAIHVYEVLGTDQKPARFSGEFTLTPEGLAAAQARIAAQTVAATRSMDLPRAAAKVTVDGDFAPFAKSPSVTLAFTEQEGATARLLYDDQYVYAAVDVRDPSPWKNAGDTLSTLFKTGDEVSLWFGPNAGKRQPGIGDVRILLAPMQGKNVAVAFRPKVAQGAQPVWFRSPSGQFALDQVELLNDVLMNVQLVPGGYRLEAAIPWSQIGLTPQSKQFGLDLSVNFSDASGQRNTARIHWGRGGAAQVYDLPTEARFEPETWGVGVLK